MWRREFISLLCISLVLGMGLVKAANADSAESWAKNNIAPAAQIVSNLFIDQSFLGRAVNFDLPESGIKVSFAAGDVKKPGVLNIISEPVSATQTNLGLLVAGAQHQLIWTSNYADVPATALVEIHAADCGVKNMRQCMVLETFQGIQRVVKPEKVFRGLAIARVKMGSTVRLIDVKGWMDNGHASWYAYKGCNCAASPDFPKGSYVKVTNLKDPAKSVVVRINDYGPDRKIFPERVIDLDKVAFRKLASLGSGVIDVKVEPVEKVALTTIAPTPPKPSLPATPTWSF